MAFKFQRRLKPKVVVDLVPMIDIVFQLVIFFMVATTFKVTTGMELNLPDAAKVNTVKTSTIRITIKDKNNIFIDNYKTDISNLNKVIKNFIIRDKSINQSVIIYGDSSMEYKLLIDVMDYLRINGFKSIDLAIRKRND
ncbi:MAG: biopolymer transporter ExbD [Spirochaetes bacterium]|nr:biopolymer transporter ExbD [Spirochaetota bacterium]